MNKPERYKRLQEQIENLLAKSPGSISSMATVAAVLLHKMEHFSWCGFYFLKNEELVVGPYQGHIACQILKKDQGVCWFCLNIGQTVIVPDVGKFPGHIACDLRTRSEIVIPLHDCNGNVTAVFDIDSYELNSFDKDDQLWLEKIARLIEPVVL
jgi:L-methionine (R)-S-oxide reductase